MYVCVPRANSQISADTRSFRTHLLNVFLLICYHSKNEDRICWLNVMNNKKVITKNVTIKSEPVSPNKNIIQGPLIPQSAIKKETPSRLPSFKPPRDLFLTGSTTSHSTPALKDYISGSKQNKRKYTPNVNIFRKKGTNASAPNDSSPEIDTKNRSSDHSKRTPQVNRRRNTNFIQTKGVFSEGLAPGKVKAFHSSYSERTYNESNVLEKPKLVLNQKVNKSNEDAKLQSILRDDFIDDPKNIPDLSFMPSSLPVVFNAKNKYHDPEDIEKTFQNIQVKVEKVTKSEDVKNNKLEVFGTFEENDCPKLLLFEFPKMIQNVEDVEEKKKPTKSQSNVETESKTKLGNLSAVGEGHWGYLRIHESGSAYFVSGSTVIPISINKHSGRQELMSTNVDQSRCRGEVINLGTIDASFTCSTNFDDH